MTQYLTTMIANYGTIKNAGDGEDWSLLREVPSLYELS